MSCVTDIFILFFSSSPKYYAVDYTTPILKMEKWASQRSYKLLLQSHKTGSAELVWNLHLPNPQPLFVFLPHTNSQVSANFKCQVHIFQQLPFFSRAGTRRWGVPSIQAQAGNTVSHPLTIKLQKKCFAPKSSQWDPARKGETQGGCRSTVAGLSTTCLSQSPDTPQWTSDNRGDVSDHSRLPWRQVQGRRGGPARGPGGQGTQMPTCRGGTSKIITAHIFKCWDGRRKVEFHWSPWAPRQPQDVRALIRSQRWTLGGQKGRLGGWVSSLPDEQTRAPSAPTE